MAGYRTAQYSSDMPYNAKGCLFTGDEGELILSTTATSLWRDDCQRSVITAKELQGRPVSQHLMTRTATPNDPF